MESKKMKSEQMRHWVDTVGEDKKRKRHEETIVKCIFSPFLFGKSYVNEKWIKWAVEMKVFKDARHPKDILDKLEGPYFDVLDLVGEACNLVCTKIRESVDQCEREKYLRELNKNLSMTKDGEYLEKLVENAKSKSDLQSVVLLSEKVHKCSSYKDALKAAESNEFFCRLRKQLEAISNEKGEKIGFVSLFAIRQYSEYVLDTVVKERDIAVEMENIGPDDVKNFYRTKGNEAFKVGKYNAAVKYYSEAIDADRFNHILYSNRAQTNLNLRKFQEALCDARRAVILKPDWEKIKNCEVEDTRMERSTNNIFNMHELQGGIFRASICGECRQGRLIILENQREGWASEYTLKCDTCEALTNFNSSRQVTDGRAHQVNRALTLGMRAIGRGQTAAATLAGFLNLPPPISAGPWAKHTSAIVDKMSGLIDEERLMAARRLKRIMLLSDADDATPEDCLNSDSYIDSLTVDVAVSFDGSWKDRGYSSHHGVVAAISQLTGEVLDVEYLCNHCSECNKHSTDDVTSTEYFQFQIAHLPHCGKNFQGIAGGMEVEGVIRLYERSKETNLQYTKFIGDGDCKSFSTIKNLQPYGPEVMISKEECVGHVQKRMGARLRRVRDKLSGQKLSDGKAIGGQGRLTLARCNAFQYFYGKCLRENKGHPEKCSREAMAILDHYSEGGDHRNCPERYCRPDRMPTEKPLPSAVVDVIKPTFKDLSDINLLQKCSEAATQNANESFHSLLWRLVPKEGYNSVTEIMLGVHMAQLYYNQGRMNSNMRLFSVAGLNPSLRLQDSSRKSDFKRMENGRRAAEEDGKKRRLELHGTKKIMGFKSKSDKSYSSGAYHSGLIEG